MTQTPARTVTYDGFAVTARLVDGVPVVLSYTVDATYSRQDFAACHGPEFLTMTPAEFVTSTPHRTQTLRDALGGVLTPDIVRDMLDAVDESQFPCESDAACTRRDCASEVLAAMADQIASLPIPENVAPVLAQFLATPNPDA